MPYQKAFYCVLCRKNISMKKSIFFAYESGHANNSDAINHGISEYNKYQSSYQAKTWEELRIGGSILNRAILKEIDECEIFSCDLTYLNHNVLFELGYAIGKRKKLLILLNPTITDAKEKYTASAILKNIGYDEFQNGRDVLRILQQLKHPKPFPIDSLLNIPIKEGDTHDLLFLSSPLKNQAALNLGEYIRNLPLRVIQNDSSEVTYQTLVWYVTNIVKCKNILIHLLGKDHNQHSSFNAEYSLFAEWSAFNVGDDGYVALSDRTFNNRILIGINGIGNQSRSITANGGVNQADIRAAMGISDNVINKMALSCSLDYFRFYTNGSSVGTDDSGTVPASSVVTDIEFDNGAGSSPFFGRVRQFALYNQTLTTTELENLTTL